jgi:hypothetical protein
MRMIRTTGAVAAAVTLALGVATPSWGTASPPSPQTLTNGLVSPLQIDVGHRGQVYTGQVFAGLLTKVRPDGSVKVLTAEQGSVSGVAAKGYNVAYTMQGGTQRNPTALLRWRQSNGKTRTVADLGAYEASRNPDAANTYGFLDLGPTCAAKVPPEIGGEPYTGTIDSNPYALANAPGGGWYVADSGANAILKVSSRGSVRTVAVLPPQPITLTAQMAQSIGLPPCTVGATYAFEPVPTDVEVNRWGGLIVSLLPGGPEDASLGARGSVVRVTTSGAVRRIAGGFLGATNVALDGHGRIYVAELFANRISVLRNGVVRPFADIASPASVEIARGRLYASTDVFGDGSIVTFRL